LNSQRKKEQAISGIASDYDPPKSVGYVEGRTPQRYAIGILGSVSGRRKNI
jgi:hypothetical protein